MYYKLEKGNETFQKLESVWDKINKCNKKSRELVEELGFKEFGVSQHSVAGGISCIKSDCKPEGYKKVGKSYQGLIYPKANNKETLSKFKKLPIVEYEEYNNTIGFESQFSSMSHHRSFGSKKVNDIFLIEVSNECEYTPTKDMVEITYSEYKKLGEELTTNNKI